MSLRISKAITPFCSACKRAGKSHSHFPTMVECCVINSWTCGYCKKTGHSIKKCPVLAAKKTKELERQRDERARIRAAVQAGEEVVVVRGRKSHPSKWPMDNETVKIQTSIWDKVSPDGEMPGFKPTAVSKAPAIAKQVRPQGAWAKGAPTLATSICHSNPKKYAPISILPSPAPPPPSPATGNQKQVAWGDDDDDDWETELANDPFFANIK